MNNQPQLDKGTLHLTTTQRANWNTFNDRIDPHALISIIPIHRSQRIAVVGASLDGLAIPIAKYVYDGSLVAFDIDQDQIESLKSETTRLHITNISQVLCEKSGPPTSDPEFDGAVLPDVLHTTTSPKSLFTQMARTIHPGGWMLVVDWLPWDGQADSGPARSYRVDPEKVIRWASETEMDPITRRVLGLSRYVHVYRKRR